MKTRKGITGVVVLLLLSIVIILVLRRDESRNHLPKFFIWSSKATTRERKLSYIIQEMFEKNQNPPDCSKAKKLVCRLYNKAGMISDVHLLLYCFHVGIMMNRTVVFDSKQWSYTTNGWEDVFEPPSKTCLTYENAVDWPGERN
ncbi:FUT8 (predicted) [Pycnogonum litorale]